MLAVEDTAGVAGGAVGASDSRPAACRRPASAVRACFSAKGLIMAAPLKLPGAASLISPAFTTRCCAPASQLAAALLACAAAGLDPAPQPAHPRNAPPAGKRRDPPPRGRQVRRNHC